MKYTVLLTTILASFIMITDGQVIKKIDNTYKFDSNARVHGCGMTFIQKISQDLQYELLIQLEIDSIPKSKEIDITKYSKFVHIFFKKYSKNNKYVSDICDDAPMFPEGWKAPTKYVAVSGILKINFWSFKQRVLSAMIKNIVLEDSLKNTVKIPSEYFDRLWIPFSMGG